MTRLEIWIKDIPCSFNLSFNSNESAQKMMEKISIAATNYEIPEMPFEDDCGQFLTFKLSHLLALCLYSV